MGDTRPHLAHIQVIHPDDMPRFARSARSANAQPLWAVLEDQMDRLTMPVLGPELTARQYPFRSLLRAGARWSWARTGASPRANPLLEIEVAVNRVADCDRTAEAVPAGRADHAGRGAGRVHDGSAYVNHLDMETGTLAAGKLADLAVLDRDLIDPGSGPIGDTRVIGTFVEGVAVHDELPG